VGKEVEFSTVLPQWLATLPLRAQSVDPVNEVWLGSFLCCCVVCVTANSCMLSWTVLKCEDFWCPKNIFYSGRPETSCPLHLGLSWRLDFNPSWPPLCSANPTARCHRPTSRHGAMSDMTCAVNIKLYSPFSSVFWSLQ